MRTRPWEVSDELWECIEELIPEPHRARVQAGHGLMTEKYSKPSYVLKTGCQWNSIPPEMCSSTTAHRRFQEWESEGLFKDLWELGLLTYDELEGIDWEWQAVDGAMTKAPLGGAASGANHLS
jgi:putative transposase